MADSADVVKKARRSRRTAAPTTPDAIEIAMGVLAADPDAGLENPAWRVLRRQEQLIGWQILKERAGFALRCLTGLVGVIVAVALGSMVWSASQEQGLVIEPFSVPPEFAAKGVTGQVLASRLLDRLSAMSDQTQSIRAPSTYANNWNGDIKVQIPQTGVSVGELRRYLVDWLGKQTTIGGELYRTPDGLSLVARTGTATATPQTGADERDLDAMIQKAAEQVYATTQPYRYAVYLGRDGTVESLKASQAALETLIQTGDAADRLWAYAGLNLRLQAQGDYIGAIRATDAAIALEPKFNLAYANRSGARSNLGHDEAAYLDNLAAWRTARSDGARFMRADGLAFAQASWLASANFAVGDYLGAVAATEESLKFRQGDPQTLRELAIAQAGAHDITTARATRAGLRGAPENADATTRQRVAVAAAEDAGAIAAYAGDWPEVVRQLAAIDRQAIPPQNRSRSRNGTYPDLAIALARLGDTERASVIIAGTPTDCYRCVIARAVVAEAAGDRPGADRWFAEAIRQAPSLPFAHEARGRARLARRDLEGALADFREAHRRGPRWADPLKGWGDVLVAQGKARDASRRYDEALAFAPAWAELRQARAQADR